MNTTVNTLAGKPAAVPNQPPIAGRAPNAGAPEVQLTPFYSTTGRPVQIALTDGGHSAVVMPLEETEGQGTPLHPRFHRKAVELGCLPVGAQAYTPPVENKPLARGQIIEQRLREMLEGNEEADFKKDGTPDLNQLQRRCGFRVSREEADAAWAVVKAE
jgi:hypothetical protein